jgi:hypothetical protein
MQYAEQELREIIRDAAGKERRRALFQAILVAIVAGTSIGAWEASQAVLRVTTLQVAQAPAHPTGPGLPSVGGDIP